MPTLIKGMARFNGLWNLDQPLDKVFLHREGQILVEVSLLLQSRLQRRLLLCQCAAGLSIGRSLGINQSLFSQSFSSHVFISINCYGQVNNGYLIAYEKVYCIQGVVKFIVSCTLGYIG
ncbi:hypothetical protein ZEAMMB73_Zm00001d050238 [Zea mays]|uniref:Uncharacterized protein n=1 Tax=Zea mays TaxID=4577 RepID=A0A1D6Q0I9_MAIZE|nr:hypothetical protein ZEAMMB73_Zm00001d050238 [Zea mays]AQK52158.1 hypothetical protein ZEAMMB73_Zm00001d050238 [Zea mays]AQK52160.1 hypothetical protein ZEAMMB73_Zm00001d050238 [Zea mays]AQK52162.1 hypothetical protein ZEAMMB73_Zm00001d050238 [Zea mays]